MRRNKKVILGVIVFIAVFVIIILFIIISNIANRTVLTCIKPNDCPLGNCYNEYKFIGYGNIVKTQERYAKIKDNEQHQVIDTYYDMLKDDKEVYDLKIIGDTIEWRSKTSMVNYGNLNNCKDDNGNILFTKIKDYFEQDEYTCTY